MKVDENGCITDYAGRPAGTNRPFGSQPTRRRAHVAFNAEDDKILQEWVTKAEIQGMRTSGDRIYEDLERVNPRHSYSSWQKRWLRLFRNGPRPDVMKATYHNIQQTTSDTVLQSEPITPISETTSTSKPSSTICTTLGASSHTLTGFFELPHTSIRSSRTIADSEPIPEFMSRNLSLKPSGSSTSTFLLPPSRWLEDISEPPPSHFRSLTHQAPVGRQTAGMLKAHDGKTLRTALGLRDQHDLLTWLAQDWVVDAYTEYAVAEFDPVSAGEASVSVVEETVPSSDRRSSAKFIINGAILAIRSKSPRYTGSYMVKTGWTKDDHDIRFVAQIVESGRAPGRWWEDYCEDKHTEDLCAIAYRLMSWLRHIHRVSAGTCMTSQWQRTSGSQWVTLLTDARARRTRQINDATDQPTQLATLSAQDPLSSRPSSILTSSESSEKSEHSLVLTPNKDDSTSPKAGKSEPDCERREAILQEEIIGDQMDSNSDNESYTTAITHLPHGSEFSNNISLRERSPPQSNQCRFVIPDLPVYPARQSRSTSGQVKALDWLTSFAKMRFKTQQKILLAAWGVTAEHKGTCVLVPVIWSALNPLDLVKDFDLKKCPPYSSSRLTFQLVDHSTTWVRAATWFADETWPRTGVEFDNFIGSGPFRVMEGSHLCHHSDCINPHHAIYEGSVTNSNRKRCWYVAQDLRNYTLDIPEHCTRHKPPCLLQHTALTTFEAYLIQFSVLRQAKGLPPIEAPSRPADHPFQTFEYQLPLSFNNCAITLDSSHLVDNGLIPAKSVLMSPIFYCCFCGRVKSYKSITGYWTHIRDKHGLIAREERLKEIVRAGTIWRDHVDYNRSQGHGISLDDPTWIKLKQIKESNFDWEVVRSWKLRYCHER